MRAVVAGGTGLVGGHLLAEVSARGVPATALARRMGPPRPGTDWRLMDLANMTAADVPAGTSAAFCCLGTTIKAAGSQQAFRAVDHGLVLAFARACREAGVPTLAVVSAAGADAGSRIFYSRVKGEAERDLAALGFPSLSLLRPSLLLGDRAERRPMERAAIGAFRALGPMLPKRVRGVEAAAVARALLAAAAEARPGVRVVGNAEIVRLGG
jgi:uncharacterized protein YbjT (DUF2867 family)